VPGLGQVLPMLVLHLLTLNLSGPNVIKLFYVRDF
jgi:hypothetical protein